MVLAAVAGVGQHGPEPDRREVALRVLLALAESPPGPKLLEQCGAAGARPACSRRPGTGAAASAIKEHGADNEYLELVEVAVSLGARLALGSEVLAWRGLSTGQDQVCSEQFASQLEHLVRSNCVCGPTVCLAGDAARLDEPHVRRE